MNSIYIGGTEEGCAKKSLVGIAHGLQNLFVVSGLIKITELVGIVKTEIQGASILINYSFDPTSPAGDTVFGTDGTAMEINADAVGTLYTWTGRIAIDLTPTTNGVAIGMGSSTGVDNADSNPSLIVPAGSLELAAVTAGGTAKTGDIDFYIRYKPLVAGANVVAA